MMTRVTRFSLTLLSILGVAVAPLLLSAQIDPTVRGVHLVGDGPPIDVYLDDVTPAAFQDVNFLDASRALTIAPGMHNAKAAASGTPKDLAVIDQDYQFNIDSAYVVMATGRLQTLDVAPVFLRRSLDRKPGPGSALVRFFHGAPDAPEVSLSIIDISGGVTTIPATSFRGSTTFQQVPGGAAVVYVIAGSDTVFRGRGSLINGGILTLIAAGDLGSESFGIYVLGEQSEAAARPMDKLTPEVNTKQGSLRLVNMLENEGRGLDVVLGAEDPVAVDFGSASAIMTLTAGETSIALYNRGEASGGTPLYQGSLEVIGGLYRAAYIAPGDTEMNEDVVLLTADATAAPGPGQGSVRFLNLYNPGVFYKVSLEYPASNRTINTSGFGSFTPYDRISPGEVRLLLYETGATDPLVTFFGTVNRDSAYTLALGPDRFLYRINDFERSGEGAVARYGVLTSVESSGATSVSSLVVVPTPASTLARMQLPGGSDRAGASMVTIVDALGRTVSTFSLAAGSSDQFWVDVSGWSTGTYRVILSAPEGGPILARGVIAVVR